MAKHTIGELDNGQLDFMWNFLKFGNGKSNMDDIANDLINVQATLEVVRLKAQYAMVKGE